MGKQLIQLMYDRSLAISLGKYAPKHHITESLTFSVCRFSVRRRELSQAVGEVFIKEIYHDKTK